MNIMNVTNRFFDLSDEVKINFNIMTSTGLTRCLEQYLEWYLDAPNVYDLFIGYIMYSCVIKKTNIDIFDNKKIILSAISVLPKYMIEYMVNNFTISFNKYDMLLENLYKNPNVDVKDFVINMYNTPDLKRADLVPILLNIISNNDKHLFRVLFIHKVLKNGILVRVNNRDQSIVNFLEENYVFLDNDDIMQLMKLEGILIRDGTSKKKIMYVCDIYKNREAISDINDISNFKIDHNINEFVLKKNNYKFIIYRRILVNVSGYNLLFYVSSYDTTTIKKVKTFIY